MERQANASWPLEGEVIVYRDVNCSYPTRSPFHPHKAYPEYRFGHMTDPVDNRVYDAVRETLRLSSLDAEQFGTPGWNPLGTFITPGQFVLLKPNWVSDRHPRDPDGWMYTITHGSIVRAVADYVWIALGGRGRVMVADGPQTDSSFDAIMELSGIRDIERYYRDQGLAFEVTDLRSQEWQNVEEVIVERRDLPGDPAGAVAFDLGGSSEFEGHGGAGRYYGADYDSSVVNRHHSGGRHEYLLAASAIQCDVLINLPKLKTHKKAGITVNLKNLVGVNADKNYLPHHTVGSPRDGGDQFPVRSIRNRLEQRGAATLRGFALATPVIGTLVLRRARRIGKRTFGDNDSVVRSGNWHGNDTTWRMCLDLNKIVIYGNPDGSLREPGPSRRKPYLSFVDGIVAGEGNGPIDTDPVPVGLILFGTNPAEVDAVAAVVMGFRPEAIPVVHQAFHIKRFQLVSRPWRAVRCRSNVAGWDGELGGLDEAGVGLGFRPHFGWRGRIEQTPGPGVEAMRVVVPVGVAAEAPSA